MSMRLNWKLLESMECSPSCPLPRASASGQNGLPSDAHVQVCSLSLLLDPSHAPPFNTMLRLTRTAQLGRSLSRSASTAAAATSSSSSNSAASSLGPLAAARAADIESKWAGTSTLGGTTKNLINGSFVESKAQRWCEVLDPVSGRVAVQMPAGKC